MAKSTEKLKKNVTLILPEVIVDLHCHGRDWGQRHKTTVPQVMREAMASGIGITAFMPNTDPALTTISSVNSYLDVINRAQKETGNRRKQYVYVGATDSNHEHCDRALALDQVLGVKIYPAKHGRPVTTGSEIGASWMSNILKHMEVAAKHRKVVAVHCDDPDMIARHGHTKDAESTYVNKMLLLAEVTPGVRIVFCHVSCRESAELILAAQAKGLEAVIELAPHYLWFDSEGTNWRKDLSPAFYDCFNRLRTKSDREFLIELAWSNNPLIVVHSDSACHTYEEKIAGAGGLPTNQQLIPTVVTLGVQNNVSETRLQELLCFNAADFYRLDISRKTAPRTFTLQPDDRVYNQKQVVSPWKGSELYFQV